jgi:hypothetical protein
MYRLVVLALPCPETGEVAAMLPVLAELVRIDPSDEPHSWWTSHTIGFRPTAREGAALGWTSAQSSAVKRLQQTADHLK